MLEINLHALEPDMQNQDHRNFFVEVGTQDMPLNFKLTVSIRIAPTKLSGGDDEPTSLPEPFGKRKHFFRKIIDPI